MIALDLCHLYIAAQRTEQGTPAGVGIMTPGQEDLVGNTGSRWPPPSYLPPLATDTEVPTSEVRGETEVTFDYSSDFEVMSGSHRAGMQDQPEALPQVCYLFCFQTKTISVKQFPLTTTKQAR